MQVTKLLTMHDEPVPEPGDQAALLAWSTRYSDADDRFYVGLEVLLADSAPFAWAAWDDALDPAVTAKRAAWVALAHTLPAGRREGLASLLRDTGYLHLADQVPA